MNTGDTVVFGDYVNELSSILHRMEATGKGGAAIDPMDAFERWCEMGLKLGRSKGVMYFTGNGASAMMASHMATDVCKNAGIRSMAFNDVSLMTAIGNDMGYKDCFSVPLERLADTGDMLVTISSSGNSQNIVRAIEKAHEMKLNVVTLSGMSESNRSRKMGDLNFYVPGNTYGYAESAHQVILHCWFDMFEKLCQSENRGTS